MTAKPFVSLAFSLHGASPMGAKTPPQNHAKIDTEEVREIDAKRRPKWSQNASEIDATSIQNSMPKNDGKT